MPLPIRDRVRLEPLTREQFGLIAELATRIWRSHYTDIIGHAQIDYMLSRRFCGANLEQYLGSTSRALLLLWHDEQVVGYCSYAAADAPGLMKLEQLYVLRERHGQGLGGLMLDHVETEARRKGCTTLVLAVNKANSGAIAIYRKRGFVVRDAVCLDIGAGFVMDDYIMEKTL